MRLISVVALSISVLTACANIESAPKKLDSTSHPAEETKTESQTPDQQVFSKSELSMIPTPNPDMVAGTSEKEVMKDPVLIKMRDDCTSNNKKFTLKKIEEVGSTKIYTPLCQ